MRSAIFLLIVSMLALGGCFDQSLESEQKNIASEKRVRIILGSGSSSRLNRFKGSYNDVMNGGSVKLSYAREGEAMQTVDMMYDGSDWTANLTLSVGIYDFRASAYNSAGVMIFDAAATKTHSITPQTGSLILGIQLNPIMEDTGTTPTPVITQITKPAGYLPGDELNMQFVVKGGLSDNLKFEINVRDNASSIIASHRLYSNQLSNITNNGDSSIYNGVIGVRIPVGTVGQLQVDFSVNSENLETTTRAQFQVAGAMNLNSSSGTIVFMPQAEFSIGVKEGAPANTIGFIMQLTGNAGFTDNVTFSFDDPELAANFSLSPDSIDPTMPSRRSGELYREVMESGALTITFTSLDGAFNTSYDFKIPGGEVTQFNTVSHVESGYIAPEIDSIALVTNTVALGETLTLNIETSGSTIGIGWFDLNARTTATNEFNDLNDWNSKYAWGGTQIDVLNGISTAHLMIRSWQVPGEWYIESFQFRDIQGTYSYYRYQPNTSQTHYIKESHQYNYTNDTWNWVQEESTVPVMTFTVTGEYAPDLFSPEITNMSLATDNSTLLSVSLIDNSTSTLSFLDNGTVYFIDNSTTITGNLIDNLTVTLDNESVHYFSISNTIKFGERLTFNIETSDDIAGVCNVNFNIHSDNSSNNIGYNAQDMWITAWPEVSEPSDFYDPYYYGPYYNDPYYYGPYVGPYYPYYYGCGWNELNLSENGTVPFKSQFAIESWKVPGKWIIRNLNLNDATGKNSQYRYEPSTSETFYVREYNKYDNTTNNWHWVNETTTLPIIKFTVTGEHTPDFAGPEILSMSLTSSTVAHGDNFTLQIEASDDVSGVSSVQLNARKLSNENWYPYYNYNYLWLWAGSDNNTHSTTGVANLETLVRVEDWHPIGEWIIERLDIIDQAGRSSNYYYQSNISENHYVRSYNRYDNLTGNTYWVSEEETTLPLLKFTITN